MRELSNVSDFHVTEKRKGNGRQNWNYLRCFVQYAKITD